MKKAIVVAAALIATSAQATSGLDFGDLNYFLKSGQFNLVSNLNVENREVQDEASGTNFETNGYTLNNRFGYGIADNLNAYVGLDYAYDWDTEIPGSASSNNDGLSNPSLNLNYRAVSQSDNLMNVDFGAVASFSMMDAERGLGGGKSGNYNAGNHTLELNTRVGRKWNEANEWQVAAGAVQNFAGEYTLMDGSGDNDIETDASTDFYLRAAYQYRPVQEFMMTVSGTATRFGEAEGDDENNNKIKDDSHIDYNFGFSAKWLINETLIARFNYSLNNLAEYDREIAGVKSEQKNRFANYYGFGIDWLF